MFPFTFERPHGGVYGLCAAVSDASGKVNRRNKRDESSVKVLGFHLATSFRFSKSVLSAIFAIFSRHIIKTSHRPLLVVSWHCFSGSDPHRSVNPAGDWVRVTVCTPRGGVDDRSFGRTQRVGREREINEG